MNSASDNWQSYPNRKHIRQSNIHFLWLVELHYWSKADFPIHFYRPQRSWAKVMFLQACVCPRGGGLHAGITPPGPDHPPPTRPPQSRSPGTRPSPRDQAPPEQTPPREADASIRSMSGRYASHWNAFLLWIIFHQKFKKKCLHEVRLNIGKLKISRSE